MNCELAHERIVLSAYGELSDEFQHELDRHLAACTECSEERHALKTAVEMLYTAHSEIDADVMEVRHAHEAGSAGEVLQ